MVQTRIPAIPISFGIIYICVHYLIEYTKLGTPYYKQKSIDHETNIKMMKIR